MSIPIQTEALTALEQCDAALHSAEHYLIQFRASNLLLPLSPESRAASRVQLTRIAESIKVVETRRASTLGMLSSADRKGNE